MAREGSFGDNFPQDSIDPLLLLLGFLWKSAALAHTHIPTNLRTRPSLAQMPSQPSLLLYTVLLTCSHPRRGEEKERAAGFFSAPGTTTTTTTSFTTGVNCVCARARAWEIHTHESPAHCSNQTRKLYIHTTLYLGSSSTICRSCVQQQQQSPKRKPLFSVPASAN